MPNPFEARHCGALEPLEPVAALEMKILGEQDPVYYAFPPVWEAKFET